MGGFRNFAISFTIISILAGCLTSYNIGFEHGGPMWVTSAGCSSASWRRSSRSAWRRSPPPIRRPAASTTGRRSSAVPGWGWATGWFNLIGQVAVTAAIGYGPRALRAGPLRLLVLVHRAHERLVRRVVRRLDLHPVRALPDRGGPGQHAEHPPDVRAEHDLGVVAHDRRRRHRRDPDHRPERPPVALVRVHEDGSTTPASATERPRSGSRSCSCSGWGCCSRSTRSRASTRRLTPPRRRTTRRGWRRRGCGPPSSSP